MLGKICGKGACPDVRLCRLPELLSPGPWVQAQPSPTWLTTSLPLSSQPDLLNFKKGWMSILDEPGEVGGAMGWGDDLRFEF